MKIIPLGLLSELKPCCRVCMYLAMVAAWTVTSLPDQDRRHGNDSHHRFAGALFTHESSVGIRVLYLSCFLTDSRQSASVLTRLESLCTTPTAGPDDPAHILHLEMDYNSSPLNPPDGQCTTREWQHRPFPQRRNPLYSRELLHHFCFLQSVKLLNQLHTV